MRYPAMLDLSCFKIIVIGGGSIAYRKVKELVHYGGSVTVISKSLDAQFEMIKDAFTYIEGGFSKQLLLGATLVIAATDDKVLNQKIGRLCKDRKILCNVVTSYELSSLIVPASVQRGNLVLSVSTQGRSPGLAKKIKQELAVLYGQEYVGYVELLGEVREKLKKEIKDEEERQQAIKELINMDIKSLQQLKEKR